MKHDVGGQTGAASLLRVCTPTSKLLTSQKHIPDMMNGTNQFIYAGN
jgi:hypothetical protein